MLQTEIKQLVANYIPNIEGRPFTLERLSGYTNITYAIYIDSLPLYIFKVFADGLDRQTQNDRVQHLAHLQLAPKVIHAEQTFRIEQFLAGTRHPGQQQFKDIAFMKRVIEQIFKFHQVSITSEEESIPDYLFSDRQAQELEKHKACSTERGNIELHKTVIREFESILSDRANLAALFLPETKQSLRFSHNDLSSPNILVDNSRIHFIDYDYLGTNYLAYDIANFLSETTFDYFSEDYPGFKHFRRLTFEEVTLYSKFYEGYYVDMEIDVFKFLSVLNLYWAFWGIKLFENYKGEGFGIAQHGMLRIQLYFYYKAELENVQQRRQREKSE